MSHNHYRTQVPRKRRTSYVHPNRACGCPANPHQHGCYNRHRVDGCRCDTCRRARSRFESQRRQRYRKYPPMPDIDPSEDVDWVVVERLINAQPVKANHAEIVYTIRRLRARGLSDRNIQDRFVDPVNHRAAAAWIRKMYAHRARLEVAA